MNEWFFDRVKDNLHLSICMSPVGDKFKDYTRNFPALINNTTIDWFMAWPEEALIEVAESYISRMDIDDQYKQPLAKMAGFIFDQVKKQSDKMALELKRIYYVTPTNFIDMVLGYEKILAQKRNEIRKQIKKLSNGLAKLEESEQQVLQMNEESEIKRADVAKKSQEVQEVKIQLARDEKVANETQQEIMKKTEIVNTEREIALKLAEEAQYQLGLALPALEEADEAVQSLDKKSIGEVRAYAAPPRDIRNVMAAVMTVLNKATDWPAIKKEMADPKFMDKIKGLDKDHMSEGIMKKIEAFTKVDTFHPAYLRQKSVVAEKLCIWVKAVEDYHKALKIVRPKVEKRDAALAKLKSLEDSLKAMEEEYAVLEAQLKKLQDHLDEYTRQMDEFRNSLENLQTRIERGDKLVNSLSEERDRWNASLSDLRDQDNELTGNAILSAAFMSLNGPFPADFREHLIDLWMR
jgi:dynein heavy chain